VEFSLAHRAMLLARVLKQKGFFGLNRNNKIMMETCLGKPNALNNKCRRLVLAFVSLQSEVSDLSNFGMSVIKYLCFIISPDVILMTSFFFGLVCPWL